MFALEIALAVAAVVVAFAVPTPEGAYSSPWIHAGGAATAGLMITFWAWWHQPRSARWSLDHGTVA
jgi:hypothetical protein